MKFVRNWSQKPLFEQDNRMEMWCDLSERFENNSDFQINAITGDESWISEYNPETIYQHEERCTHQVPKKQIQNQNNAHLFL